MIQEIIFFSNISKLPVVHEREFKHELSVSKYFSNSNFLKRLREETFNKLPFKINLVLLDSCSIIETKDERTLLQKHFNLELIANACPRFNNTITLVTKFTGSDPMKLSSNKNGCWMLCHKLGHALFGALEPVLSLRLFRENISIKNQIQQFMQDSYNKLHKTSFKEYSENYKNWADVFQELSRFKSAQERNICFNEEYIFDLVAQYATFGKTTFISPSRIYSNEQEAKKESSYMDSLIFQALNNVVGKVIVAD